MQPWLESAKNKLTLKLVTTGRRTGRKYKVKIWFAILDARLYVLSGRGEKSDWVKNIRKSPRVEITVGGVNLHGISSIAAGSDVKKRLRLLYWRKYSILMVFAELSKFLMRIPLDGAVPVLIEFER